MSSGGAARGSMRASSANAAPCSSGFAQGALFTSLPSSYARMEALRAAAKASSRCAFAAPQPPPAHTAVKLKATPKMSGVAAADARSNRSPAWLALRQPGVT